MLVKFVLFLLATSTTIWLWGHWNLGSTAGLTLLLTLNSFLLFYLVLYPIYSWSQKTPFKVTFAKKLYNLGFWSFLLITLILSVTSFYGLMIYLLPVKIILIALYLYLKFWVSRGKRPQNP